MAITLVDSNSGTGSGTPRSVTVGLTGLSATSALIVVEVSARATTFTGWGLLTPTWNGVAMTLAVNRDAALNGFGIGKAAIYYLAIGTVSGLSANAVVTANNSNSQIGLLVTVKAYDNVDQTTPLNATNNFAFTSSATTISLSCTSDPTDRVVGVAVFAETSASSANPTSGQTKVTGISTTTGSPHAQVVGDDAADGGSTTAGNWGSFNSSFSYVMSSFVESPAPTPPVILNVNGGSFADPDETNLAVNGTDFNPGGNPTELQYADSNVFATATKQIQVISGVTSTFLNWDLINLGTIGEGDNFLFVVTDPGGANEAISDAFPILVEQPEVFITRKVFQTDGTLGPTLVVPIDFDNPQFAIIRGNSATAAATVQSDAVYTICLVDTVGGKGMGIGSEDSPSNAHQREHVEGTGSVFLLDGGTGPHLIEGTPSLGPSGLTIDFTINTAGHNLEIVVIGGKSVLAEVKKVTISDGAVTGLAFRPDIIFGATACISGAGDSTFAIMAFGIAIDQGGLAQFQLAQKQSGDPRNSAVDNTAFLAQIGNSGTSYDWQMAITAINPDGCSWSGSNSDEAFMAFIRVPGRQLFLTTFQKLDVSPGGEQNLPDIGFDPGGIFLVTAGRNPISLSPTLGGRWSVGVVTAEGQDVSSASALPNTGSLVAEQYEDFTHCVSTSSVPGSISMLGRMITFGQISRIRWENSLPTNESQIGMFAIDTTDFDDGGDIIGTHET